MHGADPQNQSADQWLRGRFAAPGIMPAGLADALAEVANGGHEVPAAIPRPSPVVGRIRRAAQRRPAWSVAAAVAMVVIGGWLAIRFGPATPAPADPYATGPFQTMAEVYEARRASGFEPDWVCDDDAEFRAITDRLHGQALSMGDPMAVTDGVRMLGVAASHTFSRRTLNVLVRVDGQPVIVAIDRQDRVAGRAEAIGRETDVVPAGLYVHRRFIGDLELVELSPLAEPRAVSIFRLPAPEAGS